MVASFRSVLAGASLLLLSPGGVGAADLDGGMRDAPVFYAQPASWYLRGDVGYAWTDAGELNAATTAFSALTVDDTALAGLPEASGPPVVLDADQLAAAQAYLTENWAQAVS